MIWLGPNIKHGGTKTGNKNQLKHWPRKLRAPNPRTQRKPLCALQDGGIGFLQEKTVLARETYTEIRTQTRGNKHINLVVHNSQPRS